MRRFALISALCLCYLLFTAKSCDDAAQGRDVHERKSVEAARDSLASAATQNLTSADLLAFGENARMLCHDLGDYLLILTDSSMTGTFSDQAKKMVIACFISDEVTLLLSPHPALHPGASRHIRGNPEPGVVPGGHRDAGDPDRSSLISGNPVSGTASESRRDAGKNRIRISLKELMSPQDRTIGLLQITQPDSVWVSEGLKPVNDSVFVGTLGISAPVREGAQNRPYCYPGSGTMTFYALRTRKVFGSDTLRVWTVKLGDNH